MLYPSGAKYAGGWKDGKRHAKGDMTFANGDVYKGNWAENSPNGQGQFIGVTGVQYAGGWKDGKVRTTTTLFSSPSFSHPTQSTLSGADHFCRRLRSSMARAT